LRRLIADEWLTFDGVAQAPGYPDEDTTGGFKFGGWHMQYADEAFQEWVVKNLNEAGGFLLGRRTYESFAAHWPDAGEEEQAMAQPLNTLPKYVASRTLTDPLEWENSTVLRGEVHDAVAGLKEEEGNDLHVIGSTDLVQTLLQHDLLDELRVIIDPVIVGGGKRILRDDGTLRPMRLADSQVTTTGAIMATYTFAEG
jgi:dihydrofolate reductase